MKKNLTGKLSILIIIMVVAVSLRLYGLTYESLWNDELSSIVRSSYSNIVEVVRHARSETNPPLYYITLHVWMKVFGNSVSSVRMLSALFGILSVYFIYLLGREMYSHKEGLLSAFILAVSWYSIWYSQEARCYSMLFAFAILSFLFYLRLAFNDRNSLINSFGYALSSVILIYLHYFGVLLIFTQVFIAVIFFRKSGKFKNLILSELVIGLLYGFQLPNILNSLTRSTWIGRPGRWMVRKCFEAYWGNEQVLIWLALFGMGLFFIRMIWPEKEAQNNYRKKFVKDSILVIWSILPFLIAYIKSITSTPILLVKYTTIIVPPIILITSRGYLSIKKSVYKIIFLILFIVFSFINLYFTKSLCRKLHKEQFRGAVKVCMADKDVLDKSIIFSYAHNKRYFEYYLDMFNCEKRVVKNLKMSKSKMVNTIDSIVEVKEKQYFWILSGHLRFPNDVLEILESKYKCIIYEKLTNVRVMLFEVN